MLQYDRSSYEKGYVGSKARLPCVHPASNARTSRACAYDVFSKIVDVRCDRKKKKNRQNATSQDAHCL